MTLDMRAHMTRWNWAKALALLPLLVLAGCGFRPNTTHVQTHQALATPTPDQTTILADALTTNNNGWTDDTGRCFFQTDGYHVMNGQSCFAPTSLLSDETVSVSAHAISGGTGYAYGLQFRQQPSTELSCYAFVIDTNGSWAFFKTVENQDTELVPFTKDAAIRSGMQTTNALEVRANAGHIELFVNGTRVGQVNDTTFASGFTGLYAGSRGEAVFSNLLIRGPGGAPKLMPPGSLIFNDPLTSDLGNLPPAGSSSDAFVADGYDMTTSSVAPYGYRDFTDANIQVTVKHLDGDTSDSYGIAFRHSDGGTSYLFLITYTGAAGFLKLANHHLTVIQLFHPGVVMRTGLRAANTLQVQANGSHFEFFINGANVGAADDTSFVSGSPGLASVGGETIFSDFYLAEES
jgi:hypothetical protein